MTEAIYLSIMEYFGLVNFCTVPGNKIFVPIQQIIYEQSPVKKAQIEYGQDAGLEYTKIHTSSGNCEQNQTISLNTTVSGDDLDLTGTRALNLRRTALVECAFS